MTRGQGALSPLPLEPQQTKSTPHFSQNQIGGVLARTRLATSARDLRELLLVASSQTLRKPRAGAEKDAKFACLPCPVSDAERPVFGQPGVCADKIDFFVRLIATFPEKGMARKSAYLGQDRFRVLSLLVKNQMIENAQSDRDVVVAVRLEALQMAADESALQTVGFVECFRDCQVVRIEIETGHLDAKSLESVRHVAHVAADVQATEALGQGSPTDG